MLSDQVMWVRMGASMPPEARRSSATTVPRTAAAKTSTGLPLATVANDIENRGNQHSVSHADGGKKCAPEKQLLGDAVGQRDHDDDPEVSQSGVAKHVLGEPDERWDRTNNESAQARRARLAGAPLRWE